MRVAFTLEQCWHAVPGGTAVAALELAHALDDRGNVALVGVAARHRTAPPDPWKPQITVAHLPLPRPVLYEAWHRLRRPSVERATGQVDVIHATGIAMPPSTRPVVSTVHDLSYLDYPEMFSRQGLRFFRRALELTLAEASLVLCSSRATVARCRAAGFGEARLRHVPLGVRVRPVSDEDVRTVRTRFGLDGDYVLWTGTVEPRKNLPGLLRAFARVEPAVELALVGPSGWNEDLERVLDSLPVSVRTRVHRLGWVSRDDLAALYAGASVFCFPPRGLRLPRGRGDGARHPGDHVHGHVDRGAGRRRRGTRGGSDRRRRDRGGDLPCAGRRGARGAPGHRRANPRRRVHLGAKRRARGASLPRGEPLRPQTSTSGRSAIWRNWSSTERWARS